MCLAIHSQLVPMTHVKAPLMLTATSEISIPLPAVCPLQAIHDEEEEEGADDEDEQLRGAKNPEDLMPASQVRLNCRQRPLPFEGRPVSAWWVCREMASSAGLPAF